MQPKGTSMAVELKYSLAEMSEILLKHSPRIIYTYIIHNTLQDAWTLTCPTLTALRQRLKIK